MSNDDRSLWFGVGSTIVGSALFYFYRYYRKKTLLIEVFMALRRRRVLSKDPDVKIQSVLQYNVDDELFDKVKVDGCLPYAAVTGNVTPIGATIKSLYSQESGVVQNILQTEFRTQWKPSTAKWSEESSVISSIYDYVPFQLTGDSHSVKILEPSIAKITGLRTVYTSFAANETSAAQALLDYASGTRHHGIQTVEKLLISNTLVTAVGKVSLSSANQLCVSVPDVNDAEYMITTKPLSSFINEWRTHAKVTKYMACTFLFLGGICLFCWGFKTLKAYYVEYKEQQYFTQLRDENIPDNNGATLCLICLQRPRDVVLLDCGHVCTCLQCAERLKLCPVCRGDIRRRVPVFIS